MFFSKKYFFVVFILFFLCISLVTEAKPIQKDRYYPIALRVKNSVYLISTNAITKDLQGKKYGYGFDLSTLYVNKALWKFWNFYPEIGLAFDFYNFGQKESKKQTQGMSTLLYVEPKFHYHEQFYITLRWGLGGIQMKNIPTRNHDYYSGLLFHTTFGWNTYYKLNKYFRLNLGLNYHLIPCEAEKEKKKVTNNSQRSTKNLNFFSAYLGFHYTLNPGSQTNYYYKKHKRTQYLTIGPMFTMKKFREKYYPILSIVGKYNKRLYKNTYSSIGLAIVQDWNTQVYMKEENMARFNTLKIKLLTGISLFYGIFIPDLQIGMILFSLDKRDEPTKMPLPFFIKPGIAIKCIKNTFLGLHSHILPISEKGILTYVDTHFSFTYIF